MWRQQNHLSHCSYSQLMEKGETLCFASLQDDSLQILASLGNYKSSQAVFDDWNILRASLRWHRGLPGAVFASSMVDTLLIEFCFRDEQFSRHCKLKHHRLPNHTEPRSCWRVPKYQADSALLKYNLCHNTTQLHYKPIHVIPPSCYSATATSGSITFSEAVDTPTTTAHPEKQPSPPSIPSCAKVITVTAAPSTFSEVIFSASKVISLVHVKGCLWYYSNMKILLCGWSCLNSLCIEVKRATETAFVVAPHVT